MSKLYSFDEYGAYKIAVEWFDGFYEGIAYKSDPNCPQMRQTGKDGETVRLMLMDQIDDEVETFG